MGAKIWSMGVEPWNELPEILQTLLLNFLSKKSQKIQSKLYVELKYLELGTLEI